MPLKKVTFSQPDLECSNLEEEMMEAMEQPTERKVSILESDQDADTGSKITSQYYQSIPQSRASTFSLGQGQGIEGRDFLKGLGTKLMEEYQMTLNK